MANPDELEAIKQLLDGLEGVRVTGPDHEGLVWVTYTAPDGDGVSVNMGTTSNLTGRAALTWRDETIGAAAEQSA